MLDKITKWRYYRMDSQEGMSVVRLVVTTMLHLASREAPLTTSRISDIVDLVREWRPEQEPNDTGPYVKSLVADGVFADPERFMALLDGARPFPTDMKVILLANACRAMLWSRLEQRSYPSYTPELLHYIGVIARHIRISSRGFKRYVKMAHELSEEADMMRRLYPYWKKAGESAGRSNDSTEAPNPKPQADA